MRSIALACLLLLGRSTTAFIHAAISTDSCLLHGIVKDPYGAVVSGAVVSVKEVSGQNEPAPNTQKESLKVLATVKTNASGQYSLKLPEGRYQLCAMYRDFMSSCRVVTTRNERELVTDFSLVDDPAYKKAHEPAGDEVMDRRLADLAGASAVDCGHVLINQKPGKATSCALLAFQQRKPFRVRYDAKGIDAQLSDGLAFDSHGNGYGLLFDSLGLSSENLPKGATMPDGSHTVVLACPKPLKLRKTPNGTLSCFTQSQRFFWNDEAMKP